MEKTSAVRGLGLAKCFGDVVALDHIDFDVARGQIHGLVGPNGAGKTTLLGLLLGLSIADEGRLEFLGTPVGRALAAPDGVAGFGDGPGLYPTLTARQNLAALAALRGGRAARDSGVEDALDQAGLTDVADDKVRGFSLGMRQRLGLGAALLTGPRLLILDEPSNGLDPAGRKKGDGLVAADGPGNDWRCTVGRHVPGAANTGSAVYQLDLTANGRYIADGDGPKEVNGCFLVHTPDGDEPNPLWQFDGNVDLLPSH